MAASLRGQGYTWPRIAVALRAEWPDLTARSALRVAHGWTQEDVAIRWTARWPDNPKEPRDISGWERWPQGGRRPSLGTLERLAEIYEVDLSDLLVDVGRFSEEDACAAACTGVAGAARGAAAGVDGVAGAACGVAAGVDGGASGVGGRPGRGAVADGQAQGRRDEQADSALGLVDSQVELSSQANPYTPEIANWALTSRAIIAHLSAMPPSLLDGLVRAAYAAQGSAGQMPVGVARPGDGPLRSATWTAEPYRAGQADLIDPEGDWFGVILRERGTAER